MLLFCRSANFPLDCADDCPMKFKSVCNTVEHEKGNGFHWPIVVVLDPNQIKTMRKDFGTGYTVSDIMTRRKPENSIFEGISRIVSLVLMDRLVNFSIMLLLDLHLSEQIHT